MQKPKGVRRLVTRKFAAIRPNARAAQALRFILLPTPFMPQYCTTADVWERYNATKIECRHALENIALNRKAYRAQINRLP